MANIPAQVEEMISKNPVVIFAKSTCPYCVKAIETLRKFSLPLTVFQVNEEPNGAAVHQYLKDKTGHQTVPSIFIKQQHIGGNSDLETLKGSGKLDEMLK